MCNILQKKSQYKQNGATLIVSLVILTVVTILGLASMRNSNLELKMASSARDRGVAFQNAESALRVVESGLVSRTAYSNLELSGKCTFAAGTNCFTTTCEGGLCFTGDFDGDAQNCSLASVSTGAVKNMWKEIDWNNATLYKTVDVPNTDSNAGVNQVKYIVEFMCFIRKDSKALVGGDSFKMLPIYKITVRAEGEAGRSSVMLQSVFKSSEKTVVINDPSNS